MRHDHSAPSPVDCSENIASINKNVHWRRYRAEIGIIIGLTVIPFFWYFIHFLVCTLSFSYAIIVSIDILLAFCFIIFYYFICVHYYISFGKRFIEVQMPLPVVDLLVINILNSNNYLITKNPQGKYRDVTKCFYDMEKFNVYLIEDQYLLEIYYWGTIQDPNTLTSIYLSIKQKKNYNKTGYKRLCEIILDAINNHVEYILK